MKQTISRESERKDQRKNPIKQRKKKKLSRYRFGKQKKNRLRNESGGKEN